MTSPCWESASASASPSPWAAASKRSGPCATVAGSGSIVGGPQRPAFVLHLCEPGEDLLIALPIRGVRALQPLLEHRVLTGDGQLAERSEEHTSELQSRGHLVCRLLLEKKKVELARWDSR